MCGNAIYGVCDNGLLWVSLISCVGRGVFFLGWWSIALEKKKIERQVLKERLTELMSSTSELVLVLKNSRSRRTLGLEELKAWKNSRSRRTQGLEELKVLKNSRS